jgi:hypothetical protein
VQTVDTYEFTDTNELSLGIGQNDSAFIFYEKAQAPINNGSTPDYAYLTMARSQNAHWVFEDVANVSYDPSYYLWYGNMVLDTKGNPHLIYRESDKNNSLVYSSWNETAWTKNIVATNISEIGFLALDKYDYPHLTYLNSDSNGFMYSSWTGKAWDVQNASVPFGYLAIDSKEHPHISYLQGSLINYMFPNYASIMHTTAIEPQPFFAPSPTEPLPTTSIFANATQVLSIAAVIGVLAVVFIFLLFFRRQRKTTKLGGAKT